MRTDFIFYALAIVCFIGFLACLAWYYMERRKPKNTKAPLNWTIESAKKFLEENDKSKDEKSDASTSKTEKVVIIDKEKFKEVKSNQTQSTEKKKSTSNDASKKTITPKEDKTKTNK